MHDRKGTCSMIQALAISKNLSVERSLTAKLQSPRQTSVFSESKKEKLHSSTYIASVVWHPLSNVHHAGDGFSHIHLRVEPKMNLAREDKHRFRVCHDRLFKDYEHKMQVQINQTLHVWMPYSSRSSLGAKKYSVCKSSWVHMSFS